MLPDDAKDLAREMIRDPAKTLDALIVMADNRDFCLRKLSEVPLDRDPRLKLAGFLSRLGVLIANPGKQI